MARPLVEVTDAATGTLYAEHFIAFANIDDELINHEVGTEGYLRGVEAVLVKPVFQKAGIKHDVAMIGDIKILLLRRQLFQAFAGKRGDGTLHDLLVDEAHRLVLKALDVGIGCYPPTYVLQRLAGIDIGCQQRERGTRGNALHGCRYLAVVVRAYIVELMGKRAEEPATIGVLILCHKVLFC